MTMNSNQKALFVVIAISLILTVCLFNSLNSFRGKKGNNHTHGIRSELQQASSREVMTYTDEFNKTLVQSIEMSNSTSTANNARWHFSQWERYDPPAIGKDFDLNDGRLLIYRCSKVEGMCGGWSNRIIGVLFAYAVANLTGRTFKAEFLNPDCGMTRFLVPNLVNWSLPVPSHPPAGDIQMHKHIDDLKFIDKTPTTNFSEMFHPTKKYAYFIFNQDNLMSLSKSKIYKDQLAWMKGLDMAHIYAGLYKRLFKLSPTFQDKLQETLKKNLPTPKHRLVCIHIRIGKNPSNPHDSPHMTLKHMDKIWSFISNQSQSEFDRVFVMSDSDSVLDSSRQQIFKEKLVKLPGSIVPNIDRLGRTSKEKICIGYERLLLEFHLLMNCDLIVMPHSGLSNTAAYIRGSDDGLYRLCERDGRIFKTDRSQPWNRTCLKIDK